MQVMESYSGQASIIQSSWDAVMDRYSGLVESSNPAAIMPRLLLVPPLRPPVVSPLVSPPFSRPLAGHGPLFRSGEAGAGRGQAVSPPGHCRDSRFPLSPSPVSPFSTGLPSAAGGRGPRTRGPASWRASQQIQPQERRAKVLPPVSEHPLCTYGAVYAWGGRLELGRILYDTLFGLAPNVQPLFKRPRDAIAIKCARSRGAVGIALPLVARIRSGVELVPPTA